MYRLFITDFGVSLGKHSERLIIRGPKYPKVEEAEEPQLLLPFYEDFEASREREARRKGKNSGDTRKQAGSGEALPSHDPLVEQMTEEAEGEHEEAKKSVEKEKPRKQGRSTVKLEIPFFRLAEIIIASPGVSISADAIQECCERGIPISFLDYSGKPIALLASPVLNATIATRREQLSAYEDDRGFAIAKAIVIGKLHNQANLLKYFGKYMKESRQDDFSRLVPLIDQIDSARKKAEAVETKNINEGRLALLGIEGTAGRAYWDGIGIILEPKVRFSGREYRGTGDAVNACLNYGYGILYARVWGAVMNAGLEPFAGFLHVDRPGKPSLVLDLVEEFRQPVVDRAVVSLWNQGQRITMKDGLLDEPSRKIVGERVVERLDSREQYEGRKLLMASIIQSQARRLAAAIRRERKYTPFLSKW